MMLRNNNPRYIGWALGAFALFLMAQPAWAGGLKGNMGPMLWMLLLLLAATVLAVVSGLVGLVKVANGRGSTAWGTLNLLATIWWGLGATLLYRTFGTALLLPAAAQGVLGCVLFRQAYLTARKQ